MIALCRVSISLQCECVLIYYYTVGLRVEDVYYQKFHKEPYIMHHMYAQYFHP